MDIISSSNTKRTKEVIVITIPDTPPVSACNSDVEDHPRLPQLPVPQRHASLPEIDHEFQDTQIKLKEVETALKKSQNAAQQANQEREVVQTKYRTLHQENESLRNSKMQLEWEVQALKVTNNNLQGGHLLVWQSNATLQREVFTLRASFAKLQNDHLQRHGALEAANKKLTTANKALDKSNFLQNQIAHKALIESHDTLQDDHKILCSKHQKLQSDYETLQKKYVSLVQKQRTTVDTRNVDVVVPSSEDGDDKKPMTMTNDEHTLQLWIQQLKTELQGKEKELKETEKELRHEQKAFRDMKHMLHEEQVAMEYLKAANIRESNRHNNTLLSLRKEQDALRVEVAALRTEQKILRDECGHTKPIEIIQKLKAQVQQLEGKLGESERSLMTLKQERQTERDDCIYENEMLREERKVWLNERATLQCQHRTSDDEIAVLRSEQDAFLDEKARLHDFEEALQMELKKVQLELQHTQSALQDNVKKLHQTEVEFNELKKEKDHLAVTYETAVQELKSSNSNANECISVISDNKKCIDNTQYDIQRIIQERDDAIRLTEDMEMELHRLSNEVDYYEELLDVLPNQRVKKRKRTKVVP